MWKKYKWFLLVWRAIGKRWHSPLVLIKGNLNTLGDIDILESISIISFTWRSFWTEDVFGVDEIIKSQKQKYNYFWEENDNDIFIDFYVKNKVSWKSR